MAATIKVTNIQEASSATTNLALDSSGNVTVGNNQTVAGTLSVTGASTFTGNVTAAGTLAMASSFKRNRIINGNMLIDQRNAGAAVTPTDGSYMVDRWFYQSSQASKFTAQQNAGAVTTAIGFPNYLGMTVATAVTVGASDYFLIAQKIEGFNFADFAWGTANAKTITLSFQVYSSLTGTFGGSLVNSASTRSYPFSYTVSSANTWTSISVTIAGDTTGTWVGSTNGVGVSVRFGLGTGSTFNGTAGAWATANYVSATGAVSIVGTSGATFYITGVQLEVGTKATPYEMQIYSDQLAQCQRYYYFCNALSYFNGNSGNATVARGGVSFPVPMRVAPTTITVNSGASFGGTTGYAYVSNTNSTTQINVVQTSTVNGFDTIGYSGNLPSSSYVYAISYKAEAEL